MWLACLDAQHMDRTKGGPVGMHGQLCDPAGFVVLVHHIYMHSSVSEKFWFYEKFECTLVFFLLEV